jgi:hypothetical protein
MSCAPEIGCIPSNFRSSASAGGQLEHPSEVNNSTKTGMGESLRGRSAATANLREVARTSSARVSRIFFMTLHLSDDPQE